MPKILIVEDDNEMAQALHDAFADKYEVELVSTGEEAADRLKFYSFDLIVLDWNLAGQISGVELCQTYRSTGGQTPVLMLTGMDRPVDKETGLDSGADDYLTKPFNVRELQARVRALLRRQGHISADVITCGAIVLDAKNMSVTVDNQPIEFLPKEFAVLEFLMKHPKQFFTAEALLDRVWSSEAETSPDILRVYITRLRKKLDSPGQPSIISTRRHAGYMFEPPPEG